MSQTQEGLPLKKRRVQTTALPPYNFSQELLKVTANTVANFVFMLVSQHLVLIFYLSILIWTFLLQMDHSILHLVNNFNRSSPAQKAKHQPAIDAVMGLPLEDMKVAF